MSKTLSAHLDATGSPAAVTPAWLRSTGIMLAALHRKREERVRTLLNSSQAY